MQNTRHRTNNNFNTPLFNHSETQKCYFYQVIPIWNYLYLHLQKSVPEKSALPKNSKKYIYHQYTKRQNSGLYIPFQPSGHSWPPFSVLFRFKVNFLIWTWCTRNVIKITICALIFINPYPKKVLYPKSAKNVYRQCTIESK